MRQQQLAGPGVLLHAPELCQSRECRLPPYIVAHGHAGSLCFAPDCCYAPHVRHALHLCIAISLLLLTTEALDIPPMTHVCDAHLDEVTTPLWMHCRCTSFSYTWLGRCLPSGQATVKYTVQFALPQRVVMLCASNSWQDTIFLHSATWTRCLLVLRPLLSIYRYVMSYCTCSCDKQP